MNASLLLDEPIVISRRVAKALVGYQDPNEPQYVTSVDRPGDSLILQGERLNVMSQLLETPDADDLPKRGFSITAPITQSQKENILWQLSQRYSIRRRVQDDGASDHLNASLVDAKVHLGTINNRKLPVGTGK